MRHCRSGRGVCRRHADRLFAAEKPRARVCGRRADHDNLFDGYGSVEDGNRYREGDGVRSRRGRLPETFSERSHRHHRDGQYRHRHGAVQGDGDARQVRSAGSRKDGASFARQSFFHLLSDGERGVRLRFVLAGYHGRGAIGRVGDGRHRLHGQRQQAPRSRGRHEVGGHCQQIQIRCDLVGRRFLYARRFGQHRLHQILSGQSGGGSRACLRLGGRCDRGRKGERDVLQLHQGRAGLGAQHQ